MRLSNPKAQRYTLPVWVRGALSHQPSTTRSALNLSGFRASLGSGHAPRGHDFHEKGTRRRHAPKRSAWCMVPGVGVEPPRVARPEPRSSGGPAPLIARAIVLARRSSKPCALAAPHDRESTSPDPPPRVGSRSSITPALNHAGHVFHEKGNAGAAMHPSEARGEWCLGWESNPHVPCSPMDVESNHSSSSDIYAIALSFASH